jgi:hypothetical protein
VGLTVRGTAGPAGNRHEANQGVGGTHSQWDCWPCWEPTRSEPRGMVIGERFQAGWDSQSGGLLALPGTDTKRTKGWVGITVRGDCWPCRELTRSEPRGMGIGERFQVGWDSGRLLPLPPRATSPTAEQLSSQAVEHMMDNYPCLSALLSVP